MERVSLKAHLIRLLVTLVVLSTLLRLPSSSVEAEFKLEDWQFSKPLSLPAGLGSKEFIEVSPDLDVYSHALSGLADLRIIEEDTQREVSYKLLVERGEGRRQSVPVDIRDLGHVPGSHTSFVAHIASSDALHNEIEVITPSKEFLRKVKIEASRDQATWTVIQDESRIYDLTIETGTPGPRSTRVSYPVSSAPFLRVTIFNDDQEPLDIKSASSFLVREIPPQYESYASTVLSRGEVQRDSTTQVVIDLGGKGLPSSRLNVSIPQVNFYRRVMLETSDDAKEWTTVHRQGALFVYDTPRLVQRKLVLDYREVTSRYLRLTLFNQDSPPLNVEEVEVSGFRRRLIFEAGPEVGYRLYYGSPIARAPSYDLEQVFPYLVTEDLEQANLGEQRLNSSFRKRSTEPFTDRYPWLLPTVVALAALFLGLFLARIFQQARKSLPPS